MFYANEVIAILFIKLSMWKCCLQVHNFPSVSILTVQNANKVSFQGHLLFGLCIGGHVWYANEGQLQNFKKNELGLHREHITVFIISSSRKRIRKNDKSTAFQKWPKPNIYFCVCFLQKMAVFFHNWICIHI